MGYFLTIFFIWFSAYYDAEELKAGRYFKNHILRAAFRILVLSVISVLFKIPVLILFSVFYLIFDTSLNIMRGQKWNYIGTTAIIDIAFNKIGGWIPQYVFKIFFLIITINLKWILEFLENGLFG